MTETYRLYGMAASLYTAKVRAYMRANHIPFVEEKVGGARFDAVVKPVVGRWIFPVVETPDGSFIQDGTDILDYFEAKGFSRRSIYAKDPRLNVVSHVFELFGGEGLLRPAMHYRWNFDETNLEFLKTSFEDVFPNGLGAAGKAAAFDFASGRMRKATAFLGVTTESQPVIEASYTAFLKLLNAHFAHYPFLLGAYPTHGDYGLFNPLYAHLGRDPKPLSLMQAIAPRVYRWTERMNAPEDIVNEVSENVGAGLVDFATLPDTLLDLLRFIAVDYLPELRAHIDFTNDWLVDKPDPNAYFVAKKRVIGMAHFEWRGVEISTSVMPYRQYLLQRVQDNYDNLTAVHKGAIDAVFETVGLSDILHNRATRRIKRENHLEIWDEI